MALEFFVSFLALGTVSARSIPVPRANTCRPIPGDAAWPTSSKWNALNKTISGRLIATVPLPSVCHSMPFGTYNADACTAIKTAWLDDQTFLQTPAHTMNAYTQNYSCVPFTPQSQACELGNFASYSIKVTGADDVIAGINFAKENNVRLTIKNTGHEYVSFLKISDIKYLLRCSFAGKSTGKGALSLWTHNLNTTTIIPTYTSAGYTGPAAKLGAGVIGGELYAAVGAAGYRILGGTCPTVGVAGGYTSGGGHSLLNGAYGMAADAVLEWEVITADGQHLIATPTQNSDLYWALSGGGAGTFGVVLSMTTKIFKDGPIGSGIMAFNISSDASNYWEAIEDLWAFLPKFVDAGPNTWDFALTPTGFQAFAITVPDKTGAQVQELLQPYLDSLTKRNITYSYTPTNSASYLAYFTSRFGPGVKGAGPATVQLASRLIPRASVTNPTQNKQIVQALKAFTDNNDWSLGCHALNVKDISRPSNAVLPKWRDAIATCNIVSYWDWTKTSTYMADRKKLLIDTLIPGLEKATPGAGTYLNEIDAAWKGDWKTELYGENYDRLVTIKNKYDPNHVFYAWTAIGSDSWSTDGNGRICKK
ncbi:hypothetical protein N0V90_001916 [Kalmusia sp. IMI 367209]|nr:hypothetical protein N0V90_001916 [Kalmusia sp. IMI 367209]